jgi:hypothetical protein
LIAATALVHDLTLATRNRVDFEKAGVKMVNPFWTEWELDRASGRCWALQVPAFIQAWDLEPDESAVLAWADAHIAPRPSSTISPRASVR